MTIVPFVLAAVRNGIKGGINFHPRTEIPTATKFGTEMGLKLYATNCIRKASDNASACHCVYVEFRCKLKHTVWLFMSLMPYQMNNLCHVVVGTLRNESHLGK